MPIDHLWTRNYSPWKVLVPMSPSHGALGRSVLRQPLNMRKDFSDGLRTKEAQLKSVSQLLSRGT